MSNDYLNLINPNYTLLSYYLNKSPTSQPHSPQIKQNRGANLRNQYLNSRSSEKNNNGSNFEAQNQRLQLAADRQLINNHQTLKNLIDMIDNRKTTRTSNKFSFNNQIESQRENRFMRKSTDGLKVLCKKSRKEDLREVKEKLFDVVRLIDQKLQQREQDELMGKMDLQEIKEQIAAKSARLEYLQNCQKNSNQNYTFQCSKPVINNSNETQYQNKVNYENTISKQQLNNKRYLEVNGSINKFNQLSVMKPPILNILQTQPQTASFSPQRRPLNNNPEIHFPGTFHKIQLEQSRFPFEDIKRNDTPNQLQNKHYQHTRVSHSYQPFPNLPIIKSHEELRLMSNRNSQSSLMYCSPRVPLAPSSPPKIMIRYERPMSLNNNRYLEQNNPYIKPIIANQINVPNSNFCASPRPMPIIIPPPTIIVRQQNTNFPQPHPFQINSSNSPTFVPRLNFNNDQTRRQNASPLPSDSKTTLQSQSNSHLMLQQSSTRNSGLRKISKLNNKFSFIEHFQKNPQLRGKTETKNQNFQIREAEQEFDIQFPQPFNNLTPSTVENPFKNWNQNQKPQSIGLPDDSKFSKESLKSIVQVGDNSKYSIIKQIRPVSSSKSGSDVRFQSDLFQQNALASGSGYRTRKKGLQVSQKIFQTQYTPFVQ